MAESTPIMIAVSVFPSDKSLSAAVRAWSADEHDDEFMKSGPFMPSLMAISETT
jgi:hypothetical protein